MTEQRKNPQRVSPRVRRAKLVALMLSGTTQKEAAAEIGVSESEVSRWMQEPGVKAAIERGLVGAREAAIEVLKQGAADAASALLEAVSGAERDADKINAARAILDRVGVVGGQKVEHSGSVHTNLSNAELAARMEQLAEKLRESDDDG